jgi:hypothetical protein
VKSKEAVSARKRGWRLSIALNRKTAGEDVTARCLRPSAPFFGESILAPPL